MSCLCCSMQRSPACPSVLQLTNSWSTSTLFCCGTERSPSCPRSIRQLTNIWSHPPWLTCTPYNTATSPPSLGLCCRLQGSPACPAFLQLTNSWSTSHSSLVWKETAIPPPPPGGLCKLRHYRRVHFVPVSCSWKTSTPVWFGKR
jgi:hypothetical protein